DAETDARKRKARLSLNDRITSCESNRRNIAEIQKKRSNPLEHIKIEEFITESNQRIAAASKEINRVKNLLPFDEMTMEDFRDAYPDLAINVNKPSIWPHTPDVQPENDPGKRPDEYY
ncbi:ATP synthase subunit d, mitochondrial, partial [Trachymyrmex septentrionalis]